MSDATSILILDMLGDDLKQAVLGARERLADETVMARICEGLCCVERGDPALLVVEGLSHEGAAAFLGEIE